MNAIDEATQTILESMRQREKDFMERKAPGAIEQTPEQIEFVRAYWARVFSDPVKQSSLMMSRSTSQEMSYDEGRKKFWGILQMRAAHIEVNEGREFSWQFDEGLKNTIQNMVKYFINDKRCAWSLSKGLFVYGAPGTGKTEIMQAFEKFCQNGKDGEPLTKAFKFCSLSETHTRAKSDSTFDPVTPNVQNDRCFDEFGRYVGPVVRFGDSLDINEAVIEQRYERTKRYGQLSHFIANATPGELQNSFTPMVFDRLRSMCTSIHFSGTSKR